MMKGRADIVTDRETVHINPGDVFYIPKNLSYQSYWYGDDEIDFLSIGFQKLNTNDNTNFALQVIPCSLETVEKIKKIPTVGCNIDCKTLSLFYDAMSEIISDLKYSSESGDELTAKNVMDCIRSYPHCSISEIAAMCEISESYLYSLFKTVVHMTPNDFRQKILCENGIELLLTTNKTIEEITTITGFSSSSYFRKVLKKHTGATPREIRKNRGL